MSHHYEPRLVVPGHSLQRRGAAYNDNGALIEDVIYRGRAGADVRRTGGPGRAKCACGLLSEPLPHAKARLAWHRDHKAQLLETKRQILDRLDRAR